MIQLPRWQKLTFINTLPFQTVWGTFCTHVNIRVVRGKFAIFTNVGLLPYNVHIVDLLPFLDSVICFGSFGFTPYKASRIYIGEFFTWGCEQISF